MIFFLAFAAALLSLGASGVVRALTIDTPSNLVYCQPTLLTIEGGTPPYYLAVLPGGQVMAAPLKSFDPQSASSLTWIVDIQAGSFITLAVKDSTGTTAYSDSVMIQGGAPTSCPATASGSPTGTPPPSQQTAIPITTTTSGNFSTTSLSSGAYSGSSSSGAQSTATTRSSNAASGSSSGAYGLSGFLGLIGAILL